MRHQGARIGESIHEPGVPHIHEHRVLRDRQHVELRLDDEAERSFRAAQHAVEIEVTVGLAQVRKVVAGETAIELGEALLDQLPLGLVDQCGRAVCISGASGLLQLAREFRGVQGPALEALAAEQHAVERDHAVARLSVGAAALPACVGVDHAPKRRAVARRQLRSEEEAMRRKRGIELVLDHASLDAHAPPSGIDRQDTVHVAREVDDAVGQ